MKPIRTTIPLVAVLVRIGRMHWRHIQEYLNRAETSLKSGSGGVKRFFAIFDFVGYVSFPPYVKKRTTINAKTPKANAVICA